MSYLRAAAPAIRSGGIMVLECGIILLGLTAASVGLQGALNLMLP